MRAEHWRKCTDIFNSVLDQPPDERATLLQQRCGGDETLRRNVELLLKYHEKSGGFIESPAFETAPELLVGDANALLGQQFGHYRIESVLGVGGMGVVYLAHDDRLGRKVGLKLLPPSVVADEAQLERLKREARTASALNHPNIVTIHDIGQVDGTHYIATEFIDGITLRKRITGGPLLPNEALDIASQIASALCVAHGAGIVHRDIKPENIMLRSDGYVKVLDFGIAKFTQQETVGALASVALQLTTHPGMILGTTRYMSPEQARSQPVDGRSDVWSLGVVLYEMLAGNAPFQGETPTDVMAAVLTKEPLPLAQHDVDLPGNIQRVVEKALQKEKDARYQSASELLDDLRQVKQELDLPGRRDTLSHSGVKSPRNFFAELKRRNVYRVAVAYGVVAWLLIQIATQVFPFYEIPNWGVRLVIGVLIVGFPVALVLAWAFELAPESQIRRKWVWGLTATAAVAVVLLLFQLMRPDRVATSAKSDTSAAVALPPEEAIPAKSIAVLPFENRSEDKDNAYFADGIQDEILTRLSKIADLKVISRTSTQHYKSVPENLPEIAKQLGVAHIMEGSVQRIGDTVRVNVQLINAANDSHLWAETFDRKLTDIFSVESEVAKVIADKLRAKLTGQEEQVIAAKPTDNPEAYDAYLRGLAFSLKTIDTPTNSLGAQKYLRETVRLDPKFALAWALLSFIEARSYLHQTLQPTVALREEARQASETALTLQPNLGEALLAKGQYHYACLKDYDTAVHYFEQARQLLPNDSRIPESLALVARRRGQWDLSNTDFDEAERLDPRNVYMFTQHAYSYVCLRRFPEALRKLDQVLNITPDDVDTLTLKGSIAQAEGDLPRASTLLGALHPTADNTAALEAQVYQAILERRPAQIIVRLKEILAKPDPALGYINGELRFWLGWAQEVAGDPAAAQETWRQARSELESFLKEQPDNYLLIGDLALTNMGLADKAVALALAERAMAAMPIEKDAILGPLPIEVLARVAARLREPDRAIAALQKLFSIPYEGALAMNLPLTPALLRLDPMFDPLRNDPRFQKLAQTSAPGTSAAAVPAKSIAVLPFENRIEDKANAYFADGIQDEILTRLSKIADLKVISRTSTQHYKSLPENLPEIARQLGVAHIVEGSVQKSGTTVRVNVQLIKASDDSHIWAETFDRKLTDIFSVESEVAKAIADQLRAKLTGQEEQVIAAKPTDNPQAYDAYLRGLAYSLRTAQAQANAIGAQKYLKEAVQLDPKFALGWALLASVDARSYISLSLQPTPALREETRQAAETALKLQPNLGEALIANGYYHYACLQDYDTAESYFEQARKFLPNSSLIPESLAYLLRRKGQWDRSDSSFNEAEQRDPRNVNLLTQHALSDIATRRFPEALRKLDQVLDITPDDPYPVALKASIAQLDGDLPKAAALLAPLHPNADNTQVLETQAYQAILERRPASIIARLKQLLTNPDPALGYNIGGLRFYLGWAQEVAGDHAAAQASWQQARNELEPLLKEQPRNYLLISALAFSEMGLGDNPAALKLAESAMAGNPLEKDAVFGARPLEIFARVAAQTGEPERAIAAIEKLLSIPYGGLMTRQLPLTPAILRLDPMFDPLRNDPRFQKLVAPQSSSSEIGASPLEKPVAALPAKSIAVLPFQNLSKDEENAFFADCVQDQVLTDLAKVADLKVISRTSVMQYKQAATRNLREIARELGVSHVLEGSVQRIANRVRVNTQLIRRER